jgi:signal transduction histidine kinase
VWILLALVALRASADRVHVWALIGVIGALAIFVEIDDLRTRFEIADTLAELVMDLLAFTALVVIARRNHDLIESERAAARQEQRRHERNRAFFANTAHAQRTPITIARGHIELAMQAIDDPAARDDLSVALEELDRLNRGADRSLRLSLAGELDPQRMATVDVHELVHSTVERWKPTAARQWSVATSGSPCTIDGDREQLTEALDALVENAVLATAPGGSIVVAGRCSGESVELSVSDDGCGVAGVDTEQLFEPFEQGPRRADAPCGTGLGLAVVRAVARAHHGEATMDSTSGNGTTVRIVLPGSKRRRSTPAADAPSRQL